MMISPGFFMMIGGAVGCIICVIIAIISHGKWETQRLALLQELEVSERSAKKRQPTEKEMTDKHASKRHMPKARHEDSLSRRETVYCCPRCGNRVQPVARFCDHCGTRLK